MTQPTTSGHGRETDLLREALKNLALACEVALDRHTNQTIARERVEQRVREAMDLLYPERGQ